MKGARRIRLRPAAGTVLPDPLASSLVHDARRSERSAAVLGIALGVAFTACFATGIWSHLQQHPPGWFQAFPRPAGLYRITQGVHVATGIAAMPLLLAKLWTVYPKLFAWPPFSSLAAAIERTLVFVLVTTSVFQLVSGIQNTFLWYPYGFYFPAAHYAVSWVIIGALVIHIAAKSAITARSLRRGRPAPSVGEHDRRSFLRFAFGAAGALTLVTVGQTVRPLRRLALLAPRRPDIGPQGLPVNRTAAAAAVRGADPGVYRLRITGAVDAPVELTLDDLRALPQRSAVLPIACVEGWSATADWRGVSLSTLLARAGIAEPRPVQVRSLQTQGRYRTSDITASVSHDPDTLLALELNGEPLAADHGAPVRLIAPNRPGVLQTKWIGELHVGAR